MHFQIENQQNTQI